MPANAMIPKRRPTSDTEHLRLLRSASDEDALELLRFIKEHAANGALLADLRLRHAAPELLGALKALRNNVERDLSGYWTESTSNVMQQADAAIDQAEGRTVGPIERMTNDGSIGTGRDRNSALPCGCDPGESYVCAQHRETAVGK
jgi:hypothetical protein